MNAIFRLAADLDVQVRSDKAQKAIELTVIKGTNYDGPDTRERESYTLTPSTARAVSSALMGAAADV